MADLKMTYEYRVIRCLPNRPLRVSFGKWHILKPEKEQTTVCRQILSYLEPVEVAILSGDKVKTKSVCKLCWPFV